MLEQWRKTAHELTKDVLVQCRHLVKTQVQRILQLRNGLSVFLGLLLGLRFDIPQRLLASLQVLECFFLFLVKGKVFLAQLLGIAAISNKLLGFGNHPCKLHENADDILTRKKAKDGNGQYSGHGLPAFRSISSLRPANLSSLSLTRLTRARIFLLLSVNLENTSSFICSTNF